MQGAPIIFCFDIETRGKSAIRNGILAVGVVIGDSKGKVIYKKKWHVAKLFPEQEFEQRCIDEFWSKQPNGLLESFMLNTVSPNTFANEFRQLLNEYEEKAELFLLCDNPTFDAGMINYYLDVFGLDSMQYKRDGKTYRLVHDSDSYARGLLHYPLTRPWISDSDVQKDMQFTFDTSDLTPHDPADDATKILRQYVNVVAKITK